ncbi:uncharacterized protein LOC111274132 [Durio zibethinus]|uniref:Uncharacterized protein LOC111274132 n=1 Tax=Durio zibethinus TaxID=66656 RepID=A0A6P5WEL4_DURZI|nr:uncharacterized protein LOC111274132 [Durio zibethinus]
MKGAKKEKIRSGGQREREMATSNEKDERRRRMSEKGLNRMSHISGRAQSISSSSLPPPLDHHHHQHSQSQCLDQTNGNLLLINILGFCESLENWLLFLILDAKKKSFDAESEEARDERRKIGERGLNRTSRVTTQSNPPILNHHALFSNDHQAPQTHLSGHDHVVIYVTWKIHDITPSLYLIGFAAGPVGVGDASSFSYLKHGGMYEISSVNALDVGGQSGLKLQKPGTDKDAISAIVVGERDELKPLKETSSLQKASSNADSLQKPCKNQLDFFSSKRLNSCIIASERTRSFCALLIALFVLLSYSDYTLLGMNIFRSESIVASRPLYIIFLTDLTVVLGRLFLDKKGDSEEAEEEKAGCQNNKRNWEGAVKLLERGLVVYQTIRALFIDCSIYAVVVICGLSLM